MKRFLEIVRYAAALIGLGVFFFGLGFKWKTPAQPEQTPSVEIPRKFPDKVQIEACKISDVTLDFFGDGTLILEQDMRTAKQSRVFVVESEDLGRFDRFTWKVDLWPEFSGYKIYARAAYLQRIIGTRRFYHWLKLKRQTQPVPIIVSESEPKDKIVVLLAISGGQEVPPDCKRFLKVTVERTQE